MFKRYDSSKIDDLEFNLSVSSKVKSNTTIGKPIYDFQTIGNTNGLPEVHRLGDMIDLSKFLRSVEEKRVR